MTLQDLGELNAAATAKQLESLLGKAGPGGIPGIPGGMPPPGGVMPPGAFPEERYALPGTPGGGVPGLPAEGADPFLQQQSM